MIRFIRIEIVSRSKGGNACRKVAYLARDSIRCERTNIKYDFSKPDAQQKLAYGARSDLNDSHFSGKKDLHFHKMLIPKHADKRFEDIGYFANLIEATEKRKDSQLLIEMVAALPDNKEVSPEMKTQLALEYIESKKWVERGFVVQLAVHNPHQGEHNWHAHIALSTRRVSSDGLEFEKKKPIGKESPLPVVWLKNGFVKGLVNPGEEYAHFQNWFCKKHNIKDHETGDFLRVDPISVVPSKHISKQEWYYKKERGEEWKDLENKVKALKQEEKLFGTQINPSVMASFSERAEELCANRRETRSEREYGGFAEVMNDMLTKYSQITLGDFFDRLGLGEEEEEEGKKRFELRWDNPLIWKEKFRKKLESGFRRQKEWVCPEDFLRNEAENWLDQAMRKKEVLELYSEGMSTGFITTDRVRRSENRVMALAGCISKNRGGKRFLQRSLDEVKTLCREEKISFHQALGLAECLGFSKEGAYSGIRFLRGGAGTGKSHVLGKLNAIVDGRYNHVIGLAPTHRAKEVLKENGFENAQTVKHFVFTNCQEFNKNLIKEHQNSLFVLDEASMVDTDTLAEFFKFIDASGSELVMCGDDRQLQSIERGGLFSVLMDRFGHADLSEVRRQDTEWGREIALCFSKGKVKEGLAILEKEGRVFRYDKKKTLFELEEMSKTLQGKERFLKGVFDRALSPEEKTLSRGEEKEEYVPNATIRSHTICRLLYDWSRHEKSTKDKLVITIKNKNIEAINRGIQAILRERGELSGQGHRILRHVVSSFQPSVSSAFVVLSGSRCKGVFHNTVLSNGALSGEDFSLKQAVFSNSALHPALFCGTTVCARGFRKPFSLSQTGLTVCWKKSGARVSLFGGGEKTRSFSSLSRTSSFFDSALFTSDPLNGGLVTHDTLFYCGDRILIEESNKAMALFSGEFGTLVKATEERFEVQMDDGRTVRFCPTEVKCGLGYAVTNYKSQGSSFPSVFLFHDIFSTLNDTYVQMTRHVRDLYVYSYEEVRGEESENPNPVDLVSQLKGECDWLKEQESRRVPTILSQTAGEDQRSGVGKFFQGLVEKVIEGWKGSKEYNAEYYHVEKGVESKAVLHKESLFSSSATGMNRAELIDSEEKGFSLEAQVGKAVSSRAPSTLVYRDKTEDPLSIDQNLLPIGFSSSKARSSSSPVSVAHRLEKREVYRHDTARVKETVNLAAERVARHLLGEPNPAFSNSRQLRFGQHGSLIVTVSGSGQGCFYDHEAGSGGDLLGLWMQRTGKPFKEVISEVKSFLGGELLSAPETVFEEQKLQEINNRAEQDKKQRKVDGLLAKSVEFGRSCDKVYLEKARNISKTPCEDIRFVDSCYHFQEARSLPALVVFARNAAGEIKGCQSIYLDREKGTKADISLKKLSGGSTKGSFVEIQKSAIGVTFLAEGVETALSLREADVPGKILCSLGVSNLANYPSSPEEKVVICADNDGENAPSMKSVMKAANAMRARGTEVEIISPEEQGKDYNDLLMEQGKAALKETLRPTVEKVCDDRWLSLWENRNPNTLSEQELLNSRDADKLEKLHQERFESAEKSRIAFIDGREKQFEEMKEFASQQDIDELKASLLFCPDREATFESGRQALFSQSVNETLEKINSVKTWELGGEDLKKLYELEKTFCLGMAKTYPDLAMNECVKEKNLGCLAKFYSSNPNIIDEYIRGVEFVKSRELNLSHKEKEMALWGMEKYSLLTMSNEVSKVCQTHLQSQIDEDRAKIRKMNPVERMGETFRDDMEYVQTVLKDPVRAPHLNEKMQEDLGKELKEMERHQPSVEIDRGLSR